MARQKQNWTNFTLKLKAFREIMQYVMSFLQLTIDNSHYYRLILKLQSGAKIIETSYSSPHFPPKQCCFHDTKPQCWLKTFTQHCQWGEGGNSKKISNYMSVDASKWKRMFEIRKVSLFLHAIVGKEMQTNHHS
jgi:hypothetical protein